MIIIEAKKEDLTNGLKQLSAEMIALDQWMESSQDYLIGAVTTGVLWQFSRLNRRTKHIELGLENYRVPEDVEVLMRILVQSLR